MMRGIATAEALARDAYRLEVWQLRLSLQGIDCDIATAEARRRAAEGAGGFFWHLALVEIEMRPPVVAHS